MTAFQAQAWGESFSTREIEVLHLISNGLSNLDIARELHLSIETVKWYNKQMYMKLGVKNRTQAVNRAAELDLLDLEIDHQPKERTSSVGNLPASLTSYVGREKEIAEIKRLLRDNRLVVLTGAGGSGKTRLAIKVGEELQTVYRDGVWLVELANLRDSSLVMGTIAKVLDITEEAGAALDEALKRYLGRRQLLLLIDNLEHLLECAPLIGDLLAAAPELSVLGTSRERLHIYGEQEYPVHPLDLPDLVENKASEELANVESIALFIKRTQAVDPNISLGEKDLKDIARICVRLDGLPLAIELCAPMVKVFSLKEIADRIEKDMDAIPGGPRDLPARQQTLRDSIQWSYDILDENERRLFERLTVFNGGGRLQAVEEICGAAISGNIGNILSALVNKNMVLAREREDGEIHFGLLETIRQFGREKLFVSREAEELADRHAGYFMELAKRGNLELCGPDQILWEKRLVVIHDNMRTALEWAFKSKATDVAIQFVCDLHWFWLRCADFKEAQRWYERALALPGARKDQELYLRAFLDLSWLYYFLGKTDAVNMAEQALSLARSQPNKHLTAKALTNFGFMLVTQESNVDRCLAFFEEAKIICQEVHDDWQLARAYMLKGSIKIRRKEYKAARSAYNQSFNVYKNLGDIAFQGNVKHMIGRLEIEQNNLNAGVQAYRESLRILRPIKGKLFTAGNIFELAGVEILKENYSRAVRLYLASQRIYEDMGVLLSEEEDEVKDALETARAELDELEFRSAWEAGQNMTVEEAIEYALNDDVAAE
jgi:predicted ATPase/DNA-binding CsgD family transcriptional regulator